MIRRGLGNHGTLTGGPAWSGGRAGSALSFNGSTAYVQTPLVPASSWSGITIVAWASLIGAGSYPFIATYGSAYGDNVPQFGFDSGTGHTRWVNSGFNQGVVGTINYIGKGFNFFVGVWDKIQFTTYENGVALPSVTPANSANIAPASGGGVAIARRYDGIYFPGKIDSVLIYNRALSAAEVALLYQMTGP